MNIHEHRIKPTYESYTFQPLMSFWFDIASLHNKPISRRELFGRSSTASSPCGIMFVIAQFLYFHLHLPEQLITTLKIKKTCFNPKVPILPCRPKHDSAPIKRLFQPTLGPVSALRSKSALGNWTALVLIMGAKLDPKIGLCFTHRNGPIFRAKTDLSDLHALKP